jgi:osmotically-inducible protein OsmY
MRRFLVGSAILALVATTFSWASADDQEIARKVAERLKQEQKQGNLQGFDINLKVAEGKVTLKGTVSSLEQRELAAGVARRVDGVTTIVDDLQVKPRETEADVSDSGLASSAASRAPLLSNLLQPSSGREAAECEPGEQREAASAGSSEAADRQIGEEITRRLQAAKRSGELKGFGIALHVENGNVWLKGRVGSTAQQQTAVDLVRRVEGVRRVIDELSIGESATSIAQRLGEVLQTAERNGDLRGSDLNFKVDGPDVWLSGTVSSPEQEQRMVGLAQQVPGVRRVISGVELAPSPQASLPTLAPTASPILSASIAASRLERPQSEPAISEQPDQMTATQRPRTRALATVETAPVMTPVQDLQLTSRETTQEGESVHPTTAVLSAPRPSALPAAGTHVASRPTGSQPGGEQYVYYQSSPMMQASQAMMPGDQTPRPLGLPQMAAYAGAAAAAPVMAISQATGMMPSQLPGPGQAVVPARYDHPSLPGYAWPSYAAYPNYGAVTYPKQYSPSAWPYIGPFYPYPQVPLGWRKVTLKWDDGWWNLDFKAK